jgi:predicted dehydrogenase
MEDVFHMPADNTPGYGGYRGVKLVRDWLHAIQSGGSCRNTPRSAGKTLELLDAIYEATATGRRIECHIELGDGKSSA